MTIGEKWSSASSPDTTAAGNPIWIPNGWNRSGHYLDVEIMLVKELRSIAGEKAVRRMALCLNSVNIVLTGTEAPDQSLASIYGDHIGAPMIRKQDIAEFLELEKEHGRLTW